GASVATTSSSITEICGLAALLMPPSPLSPHRHSGGRTVAAAKADTDGGDPEILRQSRANVTITPIPVILSEAKDLQTAPTLQSIVFQREGAKTRSFLTKLFAPLRNFGSSR